MKILPKELLYEYFASIPYGLKVWNILVWLVKRISVCMVSSVRHFENLSLWMDPTSPWFTRSCMKSHEWKFAKVGPTVYDNIFKVLIMGSLSYFSWPRAHCSTCIVEQVTSEVVDIMFSWGALGLSFCEHKDMWKWPNLSIQFRGLCFIDPWIQTTLFLIFVIAATLAAVTWQFAGWISLIPFWLVILISTEYSPTLLAKYGVYSAVKYFCRNK